MSSAKEQLKQKFSSDPDRYYRVRLFDEMDFLRKKCPSCGAFFWTLDENRTTCPNPPCESYGFIGQPLKKKMDYTEAWSAIEKFFVKNGHTPIPSYPVVCRWFPGLYFTVASIVAFQRATGTKTVFEMPANPLIIPQQCMRFNDIPNVGVTGRHFTNFTMIGQHSIYDERTGEGYWKDRCVELDFEMLTKVFGIDPKEINFMEDVWVGPNAFGYSLEYYYKGLELGNCVFTEFVGTPDRHKQMEKRVIDMGAGLNRFAWAIQGTPTAYEAVFGPVMQSLLKNADYDKDFWMNYSRVAGRFNMEDFANYRAAKECIAKEMGMSAAELIKLAAPVEALYAIADHTRTILTALADGAIPSNVGGGYNLRVILRRAFGFLDEFNFDIDLYDVCNMHEKYLVDFNPHLKLGLQNLDKILAVERDRYMTTKKRGEAILSAMIKRNENFTTQKLIELYESNGITPETIEKIAEKGNIKIDIPTNFYDILSAAHMKEQGAAAQKLNLDGLPPTTLLFYESDENEFDARVLRIIDNRYVVLDKTCFYGRAGGQQGDTGSLNNCRVYDTEKYGDIIVHLVDAPNFEEGDIVHGAVDWSAREQLMKHHTAVHVIHAAAHSVLGNHVWQAGANKTMEKAHLDITHYEHLSESDIDKIEDLANDIVKRAILINKFVMPRAEAERRFGFTIYQGGAIPRKDLRIVEIQGVDVEACSGTHCDNTKEIDKIIITSTERIQDGIVRINIKAGPSAEKHVAQEREIIEIVKKALGVSDNGQILHAAERLFEQWKKSVKQHELHIKNESAADVKELEKRFVNGVLIAELEGASMEKLQKMVQLLSGDDRVVLLFGNADKIYIFGSAGSRTGNNIGSIVKEASRDLGGRGGGSASVGQGVGFEKAKLDATIKKIEEDLYER